MAFFDLTDHEYRYRETGGSFTAWTACTVKPIPVGNINIAIGDFQVRVKAIGNNPAGNILSNDSAFTYVAPANVAPVAAAGADNSITLPTDSVTLTGSGTDSDGTIASYLWTKISGTGGTITTPNAASTTVTGLTEGVYEFRLTVTDNQGATHQDTVLITVNPAGTTSDSVHVFIEGHSMNTNYADTGSLSWPEMMEASFPDYDFTNFAVPGQTIIQSASDFSTQVVPAFDNTKDQNVLFIWGCINDLDGSSPDIPAIRAALTDIVADAVAAGFKVVLDTELPIQPPSYTAQQIADKEALRVSHNEWLLANWETMGASALVVLDSDYRLLDRDSYVSADGVHNNGAGRAIVSELNAQALALVVAGNTGVIYGLKDEPMPAGFTGPVAPVSGSLIVENGHNWIATPPTGGTWQTYGPDPLYRNGTADVSTAAGEYRTIQVYTRYVDLFAPKINGCGQIAFSIRNISSNLIKSATFDHSGAGDVNSGAPDGNTPQLTLDGGRLGVYEVKVFNNGTNNNVIALDAIRLRM